MTGVAVHLRVPHHLVDSPASALAVFVERAEASGIDGLTVGDHVSFRDGTGYDGLIQATALATLSDRLKIWTAVYLLALRHPVAVARQVSSLAGLAPGRFVFGVGLGGDDRHELEVCGVDPATRGRRLDASLDIVRPLLAGETVTSTSADFAVPAAVIKPVPDPAVPIIVGGRSDAALRRAARVGDGWIAVWHSADRVQTAIARVEDEAAGFGRAELTRTYAYLVWCGIDAVPARATALVSAKMEGLYHRPFSAFERYTPVGDPAAIADALRPYVDVGVREFVLTGVSEDDGDLIDAAAEIRRLLNRSAANVS